jgi:hypothetical protein
MEKHIARDPDDRDANHNTQPVQDLLLAQNRDRPAYFFQHLDLEIRSHDNGAPANLAAAGAALAPRHDVVACFEPEWNSPDVNKTRSFNILGGIRNPGIHSIAVFPSVEQSSNALNPAHEVVKFS